MTSKNQTPLPTLRVCDRPADEQEAFSIAITGDLCPQMRGQELVRDGEEGVILEKISPFLADADLRIVQWETTLTDNPNPIPKSGAILNCAPATARLAVAGGFELALLANNHIGDHGPDVALETIEHLHAAGVRTVGAGRNLAEANAPAIFEINGRSLAVLNYAENEFGAASATQAGFAPLSTLRNLKAIGAAREQYDFVVVALHGGHEYTPYPSPRMQELFRAYAEAGAHVVFNCHTHCPEGIEFHKGTPIIYSPGNLYFPWPNRDKMWWTGYLPKFHFDAKGCHTVEVLPYTFTPEQILPFTEPGFTEFARYFEKLCEPLGDPKRMQALFETWSSHSAEGYLKYIISSIPADWIDRLGTAEVMPSLLSLRNQFTCESHADMSNCYLRLIEEGRLSKAKEGLPELFALQVPSW